MNRNDLLLKISNSKTPKPCSDYDTKTGRCKSSGKPCDTCYYGNSLKIEKKNKW